MIRQGAPGGGSAAGDGEAGLAGGGDGEGGASSDVRVGNEDLGGGGIVYLEGDAGASVVVIDGQSGGAMGRGLKDYPRLALGTAEFEEGALRGSEGEAGAGAVGVVAEAEAGIALGVNGEFGADPALLIHEFEPSVPLGASAEADADAVRVVNDLEAMGQDGGLGGIAGRLGGGESKRGGEQQEGEGKCDKGAAGKANGHRGSFSFALWGLTNTPEIGFAVGQPEGRKDIGGSGQEAAVVSLAIIQDDTTIADVINEGGSAKCAGWLAHHQAGTRAEFRGEVRQKDFAFWMAQGEPVSGVREGELDTRGGSAVG